MSFGPHHFDSTAQHGPLMGRFLLFYLLPVVACVVVVVGAVGAAATASGDGPTTGMVAGAIVAGIGVLAAYLGMGVIAIIFYSAFFREAVSHLSLAGIDFHFSARSMDWFKLLLGDIALVIGTLGIGAIFLSYRHWKFFVQHLEAGGEIDLNLLTQSTTRAPKQGEGLLDAFDVGAI